MENSSFPRRSPEVSPEPAQKLILARDIRRIARMWREIRCAINALFGDYFP
jgi:hypothetical protein